VGAQLGAKGGFNDMNLTPLIDIVLVVLIIMMVNIPIQVEEMGLKLPSDIPLTDPPPPNPDQLVIAVYEDGTVALNRRLMTEELMFYEITRRLRPMEHKNVFIDAFPTVPYGRVVDMMDTAREAGAAKVGLAKMKETGPAMPTEVAPGGAPRGMTLGAPSVVGATNPETADAAIQPLVAQLEACYLGRLGVKPELNGRVMGKVTVAPNGSLMDFKVTSSTLDDVEAEACLEGLLGTVKFSRISSDATAVVLYPLLFSPG
jgi:biopolymer transport protein ExbD